MCGSTLSETRAWRARRALTRLSGLFFFFLVKRETCIHPMCALRLVSARAWRHPREDGEQRRRPGRWRRAAPRRPRVPREPCRRPQRPRQWDVAVRFSVQWAFLGLTYAVCVSGLSLFVTESCPTTRRCHGLFSLPLPAGTWAACSRSAAALSVVPEVSGHALLPLGDVPGGGTAGSRGTRAFGSVETRVALLSARPQHTRESAGRRASWPASGAVGLVHLGGSGGPVVASHRAL